MNLIDLMEISQTILGSDDLFCMWKDIVLDSRIDKNVLLNEIMKQCGGMTPYYNVTKVFKRMSDQFFLKWQHEITKLVDTLYFEYNPIWNKDGTVKENWERNLGENENTERERNVNEKNERKTGNDGSVENETSAFNVSDYSDNDISYNRNTELVEAENNIGENEGTGRDRKEKETYGNVRVEQGNIGVTTTQQMINEERALMEFNIYNWIVNKYTDELMLCVY